MPRPSLGLPLDKGNSRLTTVKQYLPSASGTLYASGAILPGIGKRFFHHSDTTRRLVLL